MSLSVEEVVADDVRAVVRIANKNSLQGWSEADYQAEVERPGSIFLSLRRGPKCIGFLLARVSPGAANEPEAEIFNVAVRSAEQGKGGGRRLMQEFLEKCRSEGVSKVFLDVRESNAKAIRFYQKFGFREVRRSRDFYSSPQEDSVFMMADLNS